jgi:hypothetical protein
MQKILTSAVVLFVWQPQPAGELSTPRTVDVACGFCANRRRSERGIRRPSTVT